MQISGVNYGYQNYTQNTPGNEKGANIALENDSTQTVSDASTDNTTKDGTQKSEDKSEQNGTKTTQELTPDEQQLVSELAATDAHVRAHEAAHMGAGGGLTSPASFTYEKGPDNKMYAVAGEVGIATGEGNTPQETLAKAQQIRRAALAPSDPSPQDLKVAAQAASMEMSARAQIMQEKMAQNMQNDKSQNSNDSNQSSGDGSVGNSGANYVENSTGNSGTNPTGNSRIPSINQPSNTGGYYAPISDPGLSAQIASNNQKSVISAGVNLASLIG